MGGKAMGSIRNTARIAGLFWILYTIAIGFSLGYVRNGLIAFGDAGVTARNIVASEPLFRASIAADLLTQIFMFAFALAIFRLFRGVSKGLETMFLASIMISIAIGTINVANNYGALLVLTRTEHVALFAPAQLGALAMLLLRLGNFGQAIQEIFWAPYLFAFGLLVIKSNYLPRILGILLMIMSVGYPINSFTKLLIPDFHPALITDATMMLGALGALPTMIWLLIVGARMPVSKDRTDPVSLPV
jgi:hypothetical protein